MAKTRNPENPFFGGWRITWMDQWDQAYIDAEIKGFFDVHPGGQGEFQFGYIRGYIDYRPTTRFGKPAIEFSWDGNDETDQAQGRGWATLAGMNNIDHSVTSP